MGILDVLRNTVHRNTPRIKVLLVSYYAASGGSTKLVETIFRSIAESVELRTVFMYAGDYESRFRELGEVYVAEPIGDGTEPDPESPIAVTSAMIREWQPDVIYINSAPAVLAAAHLRAWNAPVVLHVHELDSWQSRCHKYVPDVFEVLPDRYIAVSDAVKDVLAGNYGIDGSRITTIHAFVNREEFADRPPRPREHPVSPGHPFVVGGSGIVSWCKGTDLWLQMARELSQILGEDDVRFAWVGVREEQADWEFRESARKLGIDHMIDFVPLTHKPLGYYAGFDVFALTSWEDSCPLVVLENMMLEKPVICFAGSGGAKEEVGEAGIVIKDFSPRAMAEEIAALSRSPQTIRSLGTAARKRVLRRFTDKQQIPKIHRELLNLARNPLPEDRQTVHRDFESRGAQEGRW